MTPQQLEEIEKTFVCVAAVDPRRAQEVIKDLLYEVETLTEQIEDAEGALEELQSLQNSHQELSDRYDDVKRALEDLVAWRDGPKVSQYYQHAKPLWEAARKVLKG